MKDKKERLFTLPVVALIALSFFLGTSEFIVVGILPELAEGFHISLTKAGTIVSVFAFAYALGTPFFAALAGKYNRYRFTLLCLIIFAFANFICAFSTSYFVFLIFRIITAVVSGTLISISLTFSGDISSPENMPKVISWIFSGFSVASVFGVPLATSICHMFGWRTAFLMIFAATIILFLILYKVLPKTNKQNAQSVLEQFLLFTNKKIIWGVLAVLLGAGATYTFYTYLTPIFETQLKIPASFISMALFVYGIAALISNLYSGKIAEKSGIRKMPRIYMVQAVCFLLLPFTSQYLAAGAVNIFALGVLMYLMNSPIQLHFLETASKENPSCVNLASSLNSVFFNFGIATGSFLGGIIVETAGLTYVGFGGAVLAVLASLCCVLLIKEIKKTEKNKRIRL